MAKNKKYHASATWSVDGIPFMYNTEVYISGIYLCFYSEGNMVEQGMETPKSMSLINNSMNESFAQGKIQDLVFGEEINQLNI